ncbi:MULTISPECIES: hypothetical protein [unclassified Pseudomonas]|uniref:hypothetical protein n=1 Tax=unclassified Pseudomonas TaxID=196821 RepID=UPI0024491AD8|nr:MULTISPECIES: hypothetical protein [unclassified Pseudomonas]MDH0896636.1 hypothetical protein [Pseudomonas sp. GD03875]MDH1066423.1 hypothetical protein [Pseudomonas sp. GD03985]
MVSRFIGVSCVLLALTACSAFQPKDDATVVAERSQARMDALKTADFEGAYAFMSPGYRSTNTLERFKASYAGGVVRLESASVSDVQCEEDACVLQVKASYFYRGKQQALKGGKPLLLDRVNEERWIKTDGQWWYVQMQ